MFKCSATMESISFSSNLPISSSRSVSSNYFQNYTKIFGTAPYLLATCKYAGDMLNFEQLNCWGEAQFSIKQLAMIRKSYCEIITANRSCFGDFDLIFGTVKQNLKVVEVSVRYQASPCGETNIIRFRHGRLLLKASWVAFKKIELFGKGH